MTTTDLQLSTTHAKFIGYDDEDFLERGERNRLGEISERRDLAHLVKRERELPRQKNLCASKL